MNRVWIVLCVIAGITVGASDRASALTIQYQAVPLGGDQWQYAYFLSDAVFDADQGFAVYFDPVLYASLEASSGPNPDWDVITVDPDTVLPAAGFYDALALVNLASLADPFVVSFTWLGGTGTIPGAQPFSVNQFDAAGNLTIIDSGRTVPFQEPVPVPEPSSLMLLGAAALGLVQRRRRNGRL